MVKVLQALPGEERRIELKPWLYRIAHNEAIEIVRRRLPAEEVDADSLLGAADPAEQVEARERLGRLLADLAELSERQRGALVMRELAGLGFEQIGAALGISSATARQTVYEARLGLRQLSEGREMDCAAATRALARGDRRLLRGRKLRAHLRACQSCRAYRTEVEHLGADLALVAPLPAGAAAGLLHAVLGGGGAAGAAGASGAAAAAGSTASVAGTAGAAAGKSLLSATALKAAAAVGVVVAISVTAADQRGLIHLGSAHSERTPSSKSAPTPTGSAAAARPASSLAAGADRGRHADRAPASGHDSGFGERSPSAARPANRAAGAAKRPPATRKPQLPAAAPGAEAAPAHSDNGKHLGQLKHPEHGRASAAKDGAQSHGKSASAPGHTKPEAPNPKPTHHHPAPAKVPPGQAKKSDAAGEAPAAAVAAPDQAPHPSDPEASASAAEPPAGAHGRGAAGPAAE
jgi:RNA polymerase sigma factor (sigma-70 family)